MFSIRLQPPPKVLQGRLYAQTAEALPPTSPAKTLSGGGTAGAGAGGGVGLLPTILSVIMGAGFGASVCSGRSSGAGGAVCPGTLNLGTNSEAAKLSGLLIVY